MTAAAFAAGTRSSSLLFCSPSLKYSSKARLGESGSLVFLAERGGAGKAVVRGGGGGEAMEAGTRRSEEGCREMGWAWRGVRVSERVEKGCECVEEGRGSSLLKRAVSNSVSPGAAGGSVNGNGSLCRAPKPSTQPRAPLPPQFRDGVMVTRRVTAYSWL